MPRAIKGDATVVSSRYVSFMAYARASHRGPEPTVVHDRLPLRSDGGLRLAVVADTHSSPHPATEELLRGARPDAILHAGDVGDGAVLSSLATVAPLFAVRGNIDERAVDLPDVRVLALHEPSSGGPSDEDTSPRLVLLLTHIALAGTKLRADVAKRAKAERAHLVVCGHSHIPFFGRDRDLTVVNPGSVGPRRFMLPIVFAILDLKDGRLGMQHIDCETGRPWEPPRLPAM